MVGQHALHQRDTSFGGYVGQANEAGVRRAFGEYQLAEVLIHRHQHARLLRRPLQNLSIAGITTPLPRFDHIVSLGSQPVSEATPRAPVDEEPHDPAMRTASRESWAITAWAYAKQARMSSGSRSG